MIFETVAQLKLATLTAGQLVSTKGYYASGDGGAADYIVAATQAVDGYGDHALAGGTVALLQFEESANVRQFGAKGDGSTDDSPAFLAALASPPVTIIVSGGTAGFVIDSDVLIPDGKTLKGTYGFIDPREASDIDNDTTYPDRIHLNSAASFILGESCSLIGLPIIRKGIVVPTNAAGVLLFAGTAITTTAIAHGTYISHCNIQGFQYAVKTAATNTAQMRCEHVNIDCTNGIWIDNANDTCYINNCHAWPSVTVNWPGVTDTDLERNGRAFVIQNSKDWCKMTDCFSYGYLRGFTVDESASVTLSGCGTDGVGVRTLNCIGLEVKGASPGLIINGFQAAAQWMGMLFNSSSVLSSTSGTNFSIWACDIGISISDGGVHIQNAVIRSIGGTGISRTTTGPVSLSSVHFKTIGGNGINNTSASNVLRINNVTYDTVTGSNINSPYMPSIASVNPLVLNGTDEVWIVTGTTNIGTLQNAADYAGRTVRLLFDDSLSVLDGGASLKLAGDFAATAGDTLTLVSDGTAWYEVSRSTN